MNREEMLAKWIEGDLTEEDQKLIRAEMEQDEEFSRRVEQHLLMRRMLNSLAVPKSDFCEEVLMLIRQKEAEEDATETPAKVISMIQSQRSKHRRMAWGRGGLASAALISVLCIVVATVGLRTVPKVRVTAAEGVGTLNIDALEGGQLVHLPRGLLELEINGESRVLLEGPAKFKVAAERLLKLSSGRCFAEMEKGKSGLRIETPMGEVLDLGTKFAIDLTSPKEMKVHVFDGEVEVSGGNAKTRLNEGEAAALGETGEVAIAAADAALFIPRVPRGLAEDAPYLHWSFDEGEGNSIYASGTAEQLSLGQGEFGSESEGAPGVRWTSGISGQALEFDRTGWVETRHPGFPANQDRTIACWVKLPADEQSKELAPLICWGPAKVMRQGVKLSVAPFRPKSNNVSGLLRLSTLKQHNFGTTNLRDGKWHHVAVVAMYGSHGISILLYVDGQLEAMQRGIHETEDSISDSELDIIPVTFGRNLTYQSHRTHLLRGSLDEVYIFGTALSGDEIRHLMKRQSSELTESISTQSNL